MIFLYLSQDEDKYLLLFNVSIYLFFKNILLSEFSVVELFCNKLSTTLLKFSTLVYGLTDSK